MRVFAVAQSEEKRNAARIKGKKKVVGKKNFNRRVCDSKKRLTNTKCKILALFVWILNNWEFFLFSLSSCIYWLEQESHK